MKSSVAIYHQEMLETAAMEQVGLMASWVLLAVLEKMGMNRGPVVPLVEGAPRVHFLAVTLGGTVVMEEKEELLIVHGAETPVMPITDMLGP